MTGWEYEVVQFPLNTHAAELDRLLNMHGRRGWELCHGAADIAVFKRRLRPGGMPAWTWLAWLIIAAASVAVSFMTGFVTLKP